MSVLGISGWELIIIGLVFVLIVGPQRLPEYTRNIVRGVRRARKWVDESRETVENEMGIAVDDLKKYDPRQYDPRRIIREAWDDTNPLDDFVDSTRTALTGSTAAAAVAVGAGSSSSSASEESPFSDRAPFDPEAT